MNVSLSLLRRTSSILAPGALLAVLLAPADDAEARSLNLSWSPPKKAVADPAAPRRPGDADYVDPGPFAGPVAEKRAGEVVFSTAPIGMTAADDAAAIESWDLAGPLYIRYFAAESQQNLLPQCREADRRVFMDAMVNPAEGAPWQGDAVISLRHLRVESPELRPVGSVTAALTDSFGTPTTLWDRAHKPDDAIVAFNSALVPQLVEGENQVVFKVQIECNGRALDLANGTLSVSVTAGRKAAWLKAYGTRPPVPTFKDNAATSAKVLELMRARDDWRNEEIRGAVVSSDAWEPVRNELTGVLVKYRLSTLLLVHDVGEPNPDVCKGIDVLVSKDPAGSSLAFEGVGTNVPLPCSTLPPAPRSGAR